VTYIPISGRNCNYKIFVMAIFFWYPSDSTSKHWSSHPLAILMSPCWKAGSYSHFHLASTKAYEMGTVLKGFLISVIQLYEKIAIICTGTKEFRCCTSHPMWVFRRINLSKNFLLENLMAIFSTSVRYPFL